MTTALLRKQVSLDAALAREEPPVRVLFVHGTLEIGGAEEVRLALLTCLDTRRYQARICCLQRGGPIAHEASGLGYDVTVLGQRAHGLSLSTLCALRRLIREYRPHIVQTSLPRANYWGRMAAALERVPVIIAEEHAVADKSDWVRPVVERVLGPRTDCVIAVSHSVRKAVAGDGASARRRTAVIWNPVNASRLRPQRTRAQVRQDLGVTDDEFLVLHVGRMDRVSGAKGHDLLLQAVASMPPTPHRPVFLFLGDGPARPGLQAMAEKLEVADLGRGPTGPRPLVRFLGWRREVANYLVAADLFVLPSRCEGMPVALMEAMWVGLPVVASDIPANREITRHGRYGKLVPALSEEPRSACPARDWSAVPPGALAQAIAALAADEAACVTLARKARRYARHAFSPERYARTVTSLWENLLADKLAARRRRGVTRG